MVSIKYLDYYVGRIPEGRKGIALSLEESRSVSERVKQLFMKYKPTNNVGKSLVYSNDSDWSLHLREPSVENISPFLVIFDEAGSECFRKLFRDNNLPHSLEAINEIM